ncbi:MAG TPA: phosphatase PAP2 family protein [Prolixibacteraceae bacterium]|nr:phosphatase PAP2 family protein [Prolixibacteraceae bacterium]
MKSLLIVFVFALSMTSSYAQIDSICSEKQHFLKHQVLPLGLITTGVLLNIGNLKETIHNHTPMTNTTLDNYLQYVPEAQMYLFDAVGIKHLNNVFNQTKYLLISQLASGIIVHALKNTTKITRPNGAQSSFPSGHTTVAFVNATVLYHEFKNTDPWLAYSGFAVATATGCLRMTNNKHWLPDVFAGAGIGILTVDLVYYFEPLKKLQWTSGHKKISFTPLVGYKSFSLACNF